MIRVAFAGKGGAGKSSISGTFARVLARQGHPVLAVDSDPLPGMAYSLGIPVDDRPTPDDVVFPPGGAWNQTLAEFIAATGAEEQLWGADFGFAVADWGEGGNFRTVEPNVDAFMTYASWNPGDLCD